MRTLSFISIILLLQMSHVEETVAQQNVPLIDDKNSLSLAYAASLMIVRDGKIAWTGKNAPTADEQTDLDAASEILGKLGAVAEEGMKVVVGTEGENKAVFFEDKGGNRYKFKIVYDPSNNEI